MLVLSAIRNDLIHIGDNSSLTVNGIIEDQGIGVTILGAIPAISGVKYPSGMMIALPYGQTLIMGLEGGDKVEVKIIKFNSDHSVRIGIQAPQEIMIVRDKLKQKILSTSETGEIRIHRKKEEASR